MSDANLPGPYDDPLDWQVCSPLVGCGERKPAKEFRACSGVCRACERKAARKDEEVRAAEAYQNAALVEFGRELLEDERRKRKNLPALSALASGAIEKFGGVTGFVEALHSQIAQAKPGSKAAIDAMFKLALLVEKANAQEVVRDVENLSDGDLSEVLRAMAEQARERIVEGEVSRPKIGETAK